jgi:hypothetical protein
MEKMCSTCKYCVNNLSCYRRLESTCNDHSLWEPIDPVEKNCRTCGYLNDKIGVCDNPNYTSCHGDHSVWEPIKNHPDCSQCFHNIHGVYYDALLCRVCRTNNFYCFKQVKQEEPKMNNEWKKFSDEKPKEGRMYWAYRGNEVVGCWCGEEGVKGMSGYTHWCYATVPTPPITEELKEIETLVHGASPAYEVLYKVNELVDAVNKLIALQKK